jgi:hypothetical protein
MLQTSCMLQEFTHAMPACGVQHIKAPLAFHSRTSTHPAFPLQSSLPAASIPFPHHVPISCEPSSCGCVEVALQMPRCHWTNWKHFQR